MNIMEVIQQEIARLAESIRGTVGFCAQHVESGQRIDYHADIHFPMASTFKVPVAAYVFALVDQGQLALEQMIEVRQSDLSPGSGTIRTLLSPPGLILSIRNLLELSLVISDNTAADVLLRLVGGPLAVTKFLRENGIDGIRLDRFTKYLVADKYGIVGLDPNNDWSLARYDSLFEQLTPEQMQAAAARFAEDGRDTMTPAAMVALLVKIYTSTILTPSSRDMLLSIMLRCQSGEGAIKGMLPPGIGVAHKTGTLAEVVANDIGIITLPGDAGHLAIAVCVKSPEARAEASTECQLVIANTARAAYDYFLFQECFGRG